MEIKKITLNGTEYEYCLQIKNIKNCYLKVRQGKIYISANPFIRQSIIEEMIYSNQDKIIKQIQNYQPKAIYENGGYVTIFNEKYHIHLIDKKRYQCSVSDDILYVYHQNIEKAVKMYCKELLLDYVNIKVKLYLQSYFDFTIDKIIIQDTKSRWGANYYKQNKLSFALSLCHLDYSLIDYVIMHELCHNIEANHSKKFYYEIEKRMPDYKNRISLLKKETI